MFLDERRSATDQKVPSEHEGVHVRRKLGRIREPRRASVSIRVTKYFKMYRYKVLSVNSAIMTHATVPAEHRAMLGISDNFIRISVGLEDADDLIQDLDQALKSGVCTST